MKGMLTLIQFIKDVPAGPGLLSGHSDAAGHLTFHHAGPLEGWLVSLLVFLGEEGLWVSSVHTWGFQGICD